MVSTTASDGLWPAHAIDACWPAGTAASAPTIALGSSIRRSTAWWRSPPGARKRTSAASRASGGASSTHRSSRWSYVLASVAAYTGGYTIPNGVGVAFLVAVGVYGYRA